MTDKMWWTSVPNSARFISDIIEAFREGNSVVCVLPEKCEWLGMMRSIILEGIHSGVKKTYEVSGKDMGEAGPGEYLADLFLNQEMRVKYRTSVGYPAFLTRIESETSLINSYIYLRDLSEQQTEEWLRFIKDYNTRHDPEAPRCRFIIEIMNRGCEEFTCGRVIRRASYLRNYDISILCMLAASGVNISDKMRNYLIDLSTLCSENDPELAALLISKGEDFLREPEKVLKEAAAESLRSNMEPFTLPEDTDNLIRRSQHRIFYPLIEEYRIDFIKKHENDFPPYETIVNAVGEPLGSIYEIELNTIKWLHDNGKLPLNKQEHEELKFIKQCRNEIAHLKVLEFSKLQRITEAIM